MKKILLPLCIWLTQGAMAQNVAINSTGALPVTSAALDIDMANKGLLIPRVALAVSNTFAPVTGVATVSLLIYNTATAGVSPNNVTPGYYYWNGTSWVRILNGNDSWKNDGNIGTSAATNFIGTTDAVDFVMRTNNTEKMRVESGGDVGIGTTNPAAKLDISAGVTTVNSIVNATGSINDFLQFNVQNTSAGTQAQSGYSATANNGTATTGFAWLGINNSAFNFPTAYNIGVANDVSYVGSGQDMFIANANNTKSIIFSTGKAASPFFNERMRITNAGNVGIGTSTPTNRLQIYEAVGTAPTATAGSIFLEHGNSGGQSSIVFKSTVNAGSDRGYIRYSDDGSGNGSSTENSLMEIGVADDVVGTFQDDIALMSSGNVGVGTTTPVAKLDVSTGVTTVNSIVNATGSINDFLQFNVQNTSAGTQAQSGYSATANNGTATTGFAWLGINNSTFNFPTAYNIGVANDVSYVGSGQDMFIANANNTKSIIFSTGKAASPFFNERMRISNAGFVGIGNTPITKLDLTGMKSTGAGTGTGGNNDAASQAIIPAGSNGTSRSNDWPAGWGGGLSTYDICGASTFFNAYNTRSDKKLKRDIATMNDGIMTSFMKIRPVTYFMKEEIVETQGLQYGFIAQEIRELFPSMVTQTTDSTGIIGMNYQALIAPTIFVLQEQVKLIEGLSQELKTQKDLQRIKDEEMKAMKIELEELKAMFRKAQKTN
jgi:hypothetical protein